MLSLLLDENISPEIARQITRKRPDIEITSIQQWHAGRYQAQPDEAILIAAAQENLTLVTYDRRTILPLLVKWGQAGTDHAGIVFIDDRSIASNNYGVLVGSLILLWDMTQDHSWTNRVDFLHPAP